MSSSTVEILLPSSCRFTLLVTLVPGLTVLDMKKLIVAEMVALGHGGGGDRKHPIGEERRRAPRHDAAPRCRFWED